MAPKRILVVDDEQTVLTVIRRALTNDHHQVETVTNAAEALSRIEQSAFDLALIDLNMPHVRGDVLIREILLRKPQLRILLMTGSLMDACPPGAAGMLVKPFTVQELRDRIA